VHHACIIHAPGDGAVAALAAELERALKNGQYVVKVKPAAVAVIPDLAAADVVLLGAGPEGRSAVHADFSELIRSLKGVSLAGRLAGVFSTGSSKACEALRRALKDSEITLCNDDLVLDSGTSERNGDKVDAWIRSVMRSLEEHLRSRVPV
jgi:flavodoxin